MWLMALAFWDGWEGERQGFLFFYGTLLLLCAGIALVIWPFAWLNARRDEQRARQERLKSGVRLSEVRAKLVDVLDQMLQGGDGSFVNFSSIQHGECGVSFLWEKSERTVLGTAGAAAEQTATPRLNQGHGHELQWRGWAPPNEELNDRYWRRWAVDDTAGMAEQLSKVALEVFRDVYQCNAEELVEVELNVEENAPSEFDDRQAI